ncbi:MAG: hypothetical protein HYS06_12310 [Methylocystis sp.]|nr:hypothetical protein [Methylocystis sp.]
MAEPRTSPVASRAPRIVLALTAATCLCAAVAAAPSAPSSKTTAIAVPIKTIGESPTTARPLGRGPAIRVGRAYDAEDEDCTLAVTRITEESGRVRVTRSVACAN